MRLYNPLYNLHTYRVFFFSVLAVNPSSDKIWHRVVQKKKWHKDTQNSIFFSFFFFVFVRLISRLTKGRKKKQNSWKSCLIFQPRRRFGQRKRKLNGTRRYCPTLIRLNHKTSLPIVRKIRAAMSHDTKMPSGFHAAYLNARKTHLHLNGVFVGNPKSLQKFLWIDKENPTAASIEFLRYETYLFIRSFKRNQFGIWHA